MKPQATAPSDVKHAHGVVSSQANGHPGFVPRPGFVKSDSQVQQRFPDRINAKKLPFSAILPITA